MMKKSVLKNLSTLSLVSPFLLSGKKRYSEASKRRNKESETMATKKFNGLKVYISDVTSKSENRGETTQSCGEYVIPKQFSSEWYPERPFPNNTTDSKVLPWLNIIYNVECKGSWLRSCTEASTMYRMWRASDMTVCYASTFKFKNLFYSVVIHNFNTNGAKILLI